MTQRLAPGRRGRHETTFFQLPEVAGALRSLSNGPLTIVVGAGASAEVGFPSWGALLDRVLNRLVEDPAVDVSRTLCERVRAETDLLLRAELLEQIARGVATSDGRRRFETLVSEALYEGIDPHTRPGPTLRGVARLYELLNPGHLDEGGECFLATTNFDLMLEVAIAEQINSKSNRPLRRGPARSSAVSKQTADLVGLIRSADLQSESITKGKAVVRHLHGHLPGPLGAQVHESERRPRDLVLTGADFLMNPDPWYERFLREQMNRSHLLFVGASMTDQHLLRSILQKRVTMPAKARGVPGEFRVVALIPRTPWTGTEDDQWLGHDEADLDLERAQQGVWTDVYGTMSLFPDWYSQVGQFLEELVYMRRLGDPTDYVDYEDRLERWFEGFAGRWALKTPTGPAPTVVEFRQKQQELSTLARGWLSGPDAKPRPRTPFGGVVGLLSDICGFDVREILNHPDHEEYLAVHLWTRAPFHGLPGSPFHRSLAMLACSDRTWQHPGAVDFRRITLPTRRTAVRAFVSGYHHVQNTASRDHQWNFVAATPVRTHDHRVEAPMTVGVVTIESTLPWTYATAPSTPYAGNPLMRWSTKMPLPRERVNGRPAPVSVLRLAQTRAATSTRAAGHLVGPVLPMDRILTALAQFSRALLDPTS